MDCSDAGMEGGFMEAGVGRYNSLACIESQFEELK
jgi:hypothetical protein